jgi:hypothetical protein
MSSISLSQHVINCAEGNLCLVKNPVSDKQQQLSVFFNKVVTYGQPISEEEVQKQKASKDKDKTWIFSPKISGERLTCVFHYYQDGSGILKRNENAFFFPQAAEIRMHFNYSGAAFESLQIQHLLNGNRFEEIEHLKPAKTYSLETWNDWRETMDEAVFEYDMLLYPILMSYMEKLIHAPTRILEIGCGNGKLAKRILNKHLEKIQHYSLYDLNPMEIEKAKDRFFMSDYEGEKLKPDYEGLC